MRRVSVTGGVKCASLLMWDGPPRTRTPCCAANEPSKLTKQRERKLNKGLRNELWKRWFLSRCQSWKVAQSVSSQQWSGTGGVHTMLLQHRPQRCSAETHARHHKALRSSSEPSLSPVSPESLQLILSPLFLYHWPGKKGPEQSNTTIIKKWLKKEKKTHFKGVLV